LEAANDGHLEVAALRDLPAMVELLLESGADVNAKDHGGTTALALAQAKNRSELVELLRSYGAEE
jgi:ankyrin repeat protein